MSVAIIITVRMASERRPGKVMADICGRPLLAHLVERYRACQCVSSIIVATTQEQADDVIQDWCGQHSVPCFRGTTNDVVGRMEAALQCYAPQAEFIMRGLGDMPLVEPAFIDLAVKTMHLYDAETFFWYLPSDTLPVYGAREWPWRRSAWDRIVANSTGQEREHAGMYLDRNRMLFKRIYHAPPSAIWFRPYRLEVDTEADLTFIRQVYAGLLPARGLVSASDAILWLDDHPEVAALNQHIEERTGPFTTYSEDLRHDWYTQMLGQVVVNWDYTSRPAYTPNGTTPIYCAANRCYLGYVEIGSDGVHRLCLPDGSLVDQARLSCACGAGRFWRHDTRSSVRAGVDTVARQ